MEIENVDLKRYLHLTKEDLRFADYLVRHVVQPEKEDVFLDGVGWEGGDEWIRAQFKAYLLSLLRTSLLSGYYLWLNSCSYYNYLSFLF